MEINLKRINDGVHFEAEGQIPGVTVSIDGPPSIGGVDAGVRPMELVLMALGSCSALDLVTILKKQKQEIHALDIQVKGTRRDEIPQVFTKIHLIFQLKGAIDPLKAEKAAELAVKKYCSVHDMLAAGGLRSRTIYKSGKANFRLVKNEATLTGIKAILWFL